MNISGNSSVPQTPTSAKWRPSVLGHFSSPTASVPPPSDTAYASSRPSLSSTNTRTSTTITDVTVPPSKISFSESIRCRSISHGGRFYDLNAADDLSIASKDNVACECASESATLTLQNKKLKKARSSRVPLSTTFRADSNVPQEEPKPQVAFSATAKGGSIPRVSFSSLSSRGQKKKKLIISGIGPNDARKFEGVKRWCEVC